MMLNEYLYCIYEHIQLVHIWVLTDHKDGRYAGKI